MKFDKIILNKLKLFRNILKNEIYENKGINLIFKTLNLLFFSYFIGNVRLLNLSIITLVFLTFTIFNSFFFENKVIKFNINIFIFQVMTVFFLERESMFNLVELPEEIVTNKDYIIYLFTFLVVLFITYFQLNQKRKMGIRVYFYTMLIFLILLENIFKIRFIYVVIWPFLILSGIFTLNMLDIVFTIICSMLIKENRRHYILILNFFVIAIFIRLRLGP